jgi:hypothetical protein
MNAISYSIFDLGGDPCDFRAYLRGLHLNIRVAEELYGTGWKIFVSTSHDTYTGKYQKYLEALVHKGKIVIQSSPARPLCEMMLWRLKPIFDHGAFDRVICRDSDSLLSLRERQAVEYWVNRGRIVHVMTDSVSHTIPIMGGMCGFMSKQFRKKMNCWTLDELLALAPEIDYSVKGSDQDFLNRILMPVLHEHMTEHYCLGRPYSYREDCHMSIAECDIPGLDMERARELNGYGFHIGAAGFQTDAVVKWLRPDPWWDALESGFPEVFYWKI